MGIERRSFPASAAVDMEQVGRELSEWLRGRGFAQKLVTRTAGGVLLRAEKSDFGRQLAGLVYTLEIGIERTGDTVNVTVDDGDLRNQIVALGLAVFVVWPFLLSAGYGWMKKGEIRGEVIAKVAQLLNATI